MSMEQLTISEQREPPGIELPKSHLEHLESYNIENGDILSTLKAAGESVYTRSVIPFPGLRCGLEEISDGNSREFFSDCYCSYVTAPEQLQKNQSEMYAFLRDRIFYGREYWGEQPEFPEMYSPDIVTLEKNRIVDDAITNCRHPFSYGNAEAMSRKMDDVQGDIDMRAEGTCGLVSSRNLMALCGKNFTEKEIALFSWRNGFAKWDEQLPSQKRGGIYEKRVCDMIRGMSGIDTERIVYSQNPFTAEDLAQKLDQGYRGMFVHNFGLLHQLPWTHKTLAGKIAEGIPVKPISSWIENHFQTEHGDHVATFECAVRDGITGKVAGFYICDSALQEKKMYVEAEHLMKALNVKDGAVVFTTKPYPDKTA